MEYKFRLWDITDKKMIYSHNTWDSGIDPLNLSELYYPYGNSYILLQFSGFLDINENEIYEGDILTATEREQGKNNGYKRIDMVRLLAGGFKIFGRPMVDFNTKDSSRIIKNCKWRNSTRFNDLYQELVNFKIIGNAYENPELLK